MIFLSVFYADELKLFKKGEIYYSKKKFLIAKSLLLKSLDKENPLNDKAYFYLANIYFHQKDYKNAQLNYAKAIEINSKSSIYYVNFADSYYKQGLYKTAIKMYKKALEINENNYHAVFLIAFANFRLKQYNKTISNFQDFLQKYPNYPDKAKILKIIDLLKNKKYDKVRLTTSSSSTNSDNGIPFSIDLKNIKSDSKDIKSENSKSIDKVKVDIDIVD